MVLHRDGLLRIPAATIFLHSYMDGKDNRLVASRLYAACVLPPHAMPADLSQSPWHVCEAVSFKVRYPPKTPFCETPVCYRAMLC